MYLNSPILLELGNTGFESNYYWSLSDYMVLNENELKDVKNVINKLLTQAPTTQLNKTVHLGKLSDLPRHKVKDYFEKNNLKKTSRIGYAESFILNKTNILNFNNLFDKIPDQCFLYKITTQEQFNYVISSITIQYQRTNLIGKFSQLKEAYIRVNKSIVNSSSYRKNKSFLDQLEYKEVSVIGIYRNSAAEEILEYINILNSNPKVNVVFDEDILLSLNKDGIELDEDYLQTLDNMFLSKDQDNINLALEMLSNVNLETNELTISLLINKHANLFIHGSGLSIKHNRSYKSIDNYFKSKNINYTASWAEFSNSLYKQHQNNPENVKIIENFLLKNLNHMFSKHKNHSFTFSEIKLASIK